MHQRYWQLINNQDTELLPAALAHPRASATARVLAQSEWLLRDKHSGRYLMAQDASGRWRALPARHGRPCRSAPALAPDRADRGMQRLRGLLHQLQIDAHYGERHGLPMVAEPRLLDFAGFDRYDRPLWLSAQAARGWQRMQRAAALHGVVLDAISGYRSHAYQLGIFRRKLARGLNIEQILKVNAAPGYSEHHSGRALDIGTVGEPAAEESFEDTAAFAWLQRHAAGFGFRMSYPRDNPHGIVYEPWHWYHIGVESSRT